MKITIKYMDDSISVLELQEDTVTMETSDEYFVLNNDDEQIIGWIVKQNVKYVIIGELIDSFKDSKDEITAKPERDY